MKENVKKSARLHADNKENLWKNRKNVLLKID